MLSYYKQNIYETYKLHTMICIGIIVLSALLTLFLVNYNLQNYKKSTETTFIYNKGSSILISDINKKIIINTQKKKKNARTHKNK
jgi:hypothetical protein